MKIQVCVVLVCTWLVALSNAATFSFRPSSITLQPVVQVWSDPVFVTASEFPTATVTLTITASDTGAAADISPSTLTFHPSTPSASFRVFAHATDKAVLLEFALDDPSGDFIAPAGYDFTASLRTVTIEQPTQGFTANKINTPSEPHKVTLQYASTQDLTLSATSNSALVFVPNPIPIPAGSTGASFVYYFNSVFNDLVDINWSIEGQESDLYQNASVFNYALFAGKRTIHTPIFSEAVLLGESSGILYAYITDQVNSTVTLTPTAADTIFTPASLQFSPGVQAVNFTFNTTTPESTSTSAGIDKSVYWTIDDDTDYNQPAASTFGAPLDVVTISTPSSYVQNRHTKLSVRIAAGVVADLQVFLFAANVQFNPTNVTFVAGGPTSYLVDVYPFAQGPDEISASFAGTDADWYVIPDPIPINIIVGEFIGPADWYIPYLQLGVQTDPFPVAINVAPDQPVTLIPTSPDLVFTPTSVTFTKDNLEATFTILPSFANSAASDPTVATTRIDFIVTGPESSVYAAPDPIPSIDISRRSIQVVFPPHVYLGATDSPFSGTAQLYVQKNYIVWATASVADQPVVVTPVSPYFTFSPATWTFSSGNLQTQVTVTPTGVPLGTNGATSISYIISGQNGGLYAEIPATPVRIQLRNIIFSSAVISPDTRVPGVGVLNPSTTDLQTNNVYSFVLQSAALPENSLTVTPRSNHISFSPNGASIASGGGQVTVNNNKVINSGWQFQVPNWQLAANFTLTPLSSGVHEVWFELSGPDAPFYDPPAHTFVAVWLEERSPGELAKPSAASSMVLNLSLSLLVVVLAVLL